MLRLSALIAVPAFMFALSASSFAADVNSDAAAPSTSRGLNSATPGQEGNALQQRLQNNMSGNRNQSAQMPDQSDSNSDSDRPEATRGTRDQDSDSSVNKTLNNAIDKINPNSSSPSTSTPGR